MAFNMSHRISVLVRSHNDIRFIARTLDGLLSQESSYPFEIICCDDDSSDGTAELISSYSGVICLSRPGGLYLPGRVLNYMVRHCSGDIIVFNNADAPPLNKFYLEHLVRPLIAGEADAVFANQLPRSDAYWLVRKDHLRAFGDGRIAKSWRYNFSLAASGTFRDLLVSEPFSEELLYSEDIEWCYCRTSRRVQYVADALVEHSHNYSWGELRRRFYGEGYADGLMFKHGGSSFVRAFCGACAEVVRDWYFLLYHPSGWGEILSSPVRRMIQRISFRNGRRDALKSRTGGIS